MPDQVPEKKPLKIFGRGFLQARCPSHRSTNSFKELQGKIRQNMVVGFYIDNQTSATNLSTKNRQLDSGKANQTKPRQHPGRVTCDHGN